MSGSAFQTKRRFGLIRIFVVIALYATSAFIVALQTIWFYAQSWRLIVYYFVHATIFASVVFATHFLSRQYSIALLAIAAIVIGAIPFESTLNFALQLVSDSDIDDELFSHLTHGLPDYLRVAFEFGLYPLGHFAVLLIASAVIGRREQMKTP